MASPFHPSTFPTMSLGAPANLAASSNNETMPPPPAADPSSVLSAIHSCSSHDASIRRPAEEQLQQWENAYLGGHAAGYLTSLISIVDSSSSSSPASTVDDSGRLLAAILLKNGILKAFCVPIEEDVNNTTSEERVQFERMGQERSLVRSRLPALLFHETNATCALHLQLALSNIALFDFPKSWPSLLEDLVSVATSGQFGGGAVSPEHAMTIRLRAIKTLRLCLQSIRQRRVVVPKSSVKLGGGAKSGMGHPMMNMGNLGSIIGKAVNERKEMHGKACSIFAAVAEGIVNHAQGAVTGSDNGSVSDAYLAWQTGSQLAVGYIKCMTELVPMIEIGNINADPRTPAVRKLLESLAQICEAVKVYPAAALPPPLGNLSHVPITSVLQEYTMKMDKIYRATLICSMTSIRYLPQLFAPQIALLLPAVVEPILTLDSTVLQTMPVKRLMMMTSIVRAVLTCTLYDEKRKGLLSSSKKNAVLSMLMGGTAGGNNNDDATNNPNEDPGVIEAQKTVTALLAEGTIERLVESLVGKFLRLNEEELEEWEDDPEGRYETDLAEKSLLELDSPRHCGGALLSTLMNRETDRVAQTLLELTQRVYQQLPADDVNGMLSREACYRALELCHVAMVSGGQRRLNFSDWFNSELRPILQTDLAENSHVAMRAMQARAVQVVQRYSTSLKPEEFGVSFQSIARLMAAPDLVTCFCSARCINHLALLHVKGTEESAQLTSVREHSVFALGNAFALAHRSESEECLRVILMCVSALVESNGLYLEPVLQAIAEQLPGLWEKAKDSVPIHSCLLSVLNHLIMKMGASTVENSHVQTVLFPLLDYCTDISVVNRAETLLEDGLRLWLVTVVSSRVAAMGPSLTNMLPRLEAILRSGLEPHLSLKVLQYNAILLGPQVVEPLASVLRDMLVNLTSCIHAEQKDDDDTAMDSVDGSKGTDRGMTTMRNAVAALSFADGMMQMFPELGLSICSPAMAKVIAALPGKAMSQPVLEATLHSFGRMLWLNPNSLNEIFANDPNQDEKISSVVSAWITVVTSVSVLVMLSAQAQKITFIDQKGAALSLCSAACRSPIVARVAGRSIIDFTRKLLEVESKSKLDVDALVEAMTGTTRKVVGDGPLGDSAARTAEILKSDPLLTVSLREALESAEKSMTNV
eukprot:CAMPEP_0183713024 /NCGR_PEP_ID=MMETSP0737-20130205/8028_1 /TAXON_ID=385413 /ORGANISM="Thalassiosira miniscula, Strain CCMP1093" /LENGTH=1154 /DNA_ID=CAMNT_0025941773 /DNA_START=175 /DNA_END=3639 /DNA_ORIENTATION=-